MATKNSTQVAAGVLPKAIHAGLNVAYGTYANSGTLSVSDTIQMVTVPHGAIVVDTHISGHIDNAGATVKIGDGGDDDRYGSVSLSVTSSYVRSNAATGHAYQYSVSDDATARYDTIDITVAASASTTSSASFNLTVFYYMPPKF